jgi:hypothetical protein
MSEIVNRHCINCLHLETEHLNLGTFKACPSGPGQFYLAVEFVPATNLEYLEKKADETIR